MSGLTSNEDKFDRFYMIVHSVKYRQRLDETFVKETTVTQL